MLKILFFLLLVSEQVVQCECFKKWTVDGAVHYNMTWLSQVWAFKMK